MKLKLYLSKVVKYKEGKTHPRHLYIVFEQLFFSKKAGKHDSHSLKAEGQFSIFLFFNLGILFHERIKMER